jgi:hypothetical protein
MVGVNVSNHYLSDIFKSEAAESQTIPQCREGLRGIKAGVNQQIAIAAFYQIGIDVV